MAVTDTDATERVEPEPDAARDPSRLLALLAHRAWNPPPSSSLAEEEHLRSLLLRAAAREFPTLAARAGSGP